MPGLNGFELIETIGVDKMPAVIFTTAYDQYAIDAFEVNAVDYLLKPFDSTRFQKSFQRAVLEINREKRPAELITNLLESINKEKKSFDKFIVKKGQKYFFVPVDKVCFLSAEDKYVQISTETESYLIRDSIANIENKLDANIFKRVHRSTLVNVNYVKEIQPWSHGDFIIILSNGKKIDASRTYRDKIFGEK
jgi:two-component system LytT family response regulator